MYLYICIFESFFEEISQRQIKSGKILMIIWRANQTICDTKKKGGNTPRTIPKVGFPAAPSTEGVSTTKKSCQ